MIDLVEKYSRISSHIDFDELFDHRLIFIGTGASTHLIEWFARLGVKKFTLCDLDIVEHKNLAVQGFDYDDVGSSKVDAVKKRLERIEFEKGNENVPALDVITFNQDFLTLTDEEVFSGDGKKILIMASDYHPVQARGSRLALKYSVPTFWVGIYREAMAGEIIFFDNSNADEDFNMQKSLQPCYRCITKTRYESFDKRHLASHKKGEFNGAGKSSGLPMAATYIDSILGHLIIGAIHQTDLNNRHARLYTKLKSEGRNLIQTQLSPEYLLGSEDIFEQAKGKDMISFNTLFQHEKVDEECPDCKTFYSLINEEKSSNYTVTTDYTLE
jgi:molybdopterin/thiamine biosynthesis adenylyltransferase